MMMVLVMMIVMVNLDDGAWPLFGIQVARLVPFPKRLGVHLAIIHLAIVMLYATRKWRRQRKRW